MDSAREFVQSNAAYVTAGVVGIGLMWVMLKKLTKKTRKCGIDYPKDTVILHVFTRTKDIPNLGHFEMKLRTYLKISGIPFQVDNNFKNSPKGKVPWIEYNDLAMGDSQLIMEFLNKEFSVDLNEHLSAVERSQAWAIQKWIEEFTYWLNVYTRWLIFSDDMLSDVLEFSTTKKLLTKLSLMSSVRKMAYYVGVGRHSDTEVHEMMKNDIRHFATLLGDKKYLMGDRVSEVDCSAFGVLSQVRWATPEKCPGRELLLGQQNVMDYLDRIKNTYWPDWDE